MSMLSDQDGFIASRSEALVGFILEHFRRHGIAREHAITILALTWQRIKAGALDHPGTSH